MEQRHWLLRALACVVGLIRGCIVESFALAEESEGESGDDFPTDEEVAGIGIMVMEEDL